ncbi:MAG: HAMP domain-containing sensor histidine kinase [Candidatus Gastranaerophilales bacterium]|nr:HAMP domain-containing sensor histidine kinase [Candidatus Gastranaerophilales bacterium]
MTIKYQILNKLSNAINKDYCLPQGDSFYQEMLNEINAEFSCEASGVYFLDDISISKKAFLSKDKNVADVFSKEKHSELLKMLNLKSEKTFVLKKPCVKPFLEANLKYAEYNFLFSKLSIKNSIFGFVFFVKKEPFSDEEIALLNLSVSIYSYVIKDFELNNVLKSQLSILQDAILEKEEAYKIIKKQNNKLIEADNAKTSFLANVSHELRTPLNAIIGFSDVLLNQIFGKLNKKQAEYIGDINRSSIHLLGLINSVLDFSKIESGSMKLNLSKFYPKDAVNEVINLLSSLLDAKEIRIIYNDSYKEELNADYQKFQQILFNLIGNAIKFSKQKGEIIVRTKKDREYFVLEVEDFGIGIEKKYHNFIFKKFTQIDNIYTKTSASTGLGLAITKEYVSLHNGKIHVVSKLGSGSTFVVKLSNNR